MANYASSALVNAQINIGRRYNEAELRRKQHPVLNMAVGNQDRAVPNIEDVRKSENRPVEVKYFIRRAAGATTSKAPRHTGSKGDSGTITPAWNTIVEKFDISRKQAQNNTISWQRQFANEIEQAVKNVTDRAESSGIANLFANRLQVASPTDSGAGTWNATNYALEVSAANKTRFQQFAESFLAGRQYRGPYDVITDLTEYRELQYQQAQGAGNQANLNFQFGNSNIAYTTDIISAAYSAGQEIILPAGMFAALTWNDPLNRSGYDAGTDSYNGSLGTMADPYGSGLVFDVSIWTDRSDESARGGGVQDIVDHWEISLQLGWLVPPMSTAGESPIHLVAQGS